VLAISMGWAVAAWWTRWSERDTARLAKKLGGLEHPSLGDRAARAVHLVGSTDAAGDPLGAGLARIHLERLLAQVRTETL
jgi:hypothetical protein